MKYIINIPDDIQKIIGLRQDYSLIYVDMTPYTEPDRKAIENEVWSIAREIAYCMSLDECEDAGMLCDDDIYESATGVLEKLSYQEAKAKYDEWKKQKEEIHVGDEVKPKTNQRKGTVISEGTDYVRVLFEDVDYPFISAWEKKNVIKTGRHFDEVERLLERMREQK